MPQIFLPDTLKRLRLQRQLTQAEVADAIGVQQRTYSNPRRRVEQPRPPERGRGRL